MLKLITRTSLIAASLLTLQACSWFKEKPPEYMDSEEVARLQVPEGLDTPQYNNPLIITAPEMRKPSGDELNPSPPRVTSTAGRGDSNAYLAWSAEGVYMEVKDTPASVSRRLGFAIERTGMNLMERDNATGAHRFEYVHIRQDDRSFWQKMAFWQRDSVPNYSGFYRTRVVPDGENSRVYLQFDSGDQATTVAAEHILGIFMERFG